MAVTLVVNTGSSSKKFALYKNDEKLISAHIESCDDVYSVCVLVEDMQQRCDTLKGGQYDKYLENFLTEVREKGLVGDYSEIKKVALRVVAPGTFFQSHRKINDDYLHKLRTAEANAPLHIPHLLREIKIIKNLLPESQLVAISDSAYHSTLPKHARDYSLPKKDTIDHDLHRFGYHGISVSSVLNRTHAIIGSNPKRVIVCHIGSGVSITAVKDGKSVDTTMGYAPGTGLIMGSRAGDLDSGALLALMRFKNLKPVDAENYLQTNGGLKGLSGESDLRLILKQKAEEDIVAKETIQSFVYQIKKAIGSYMAVLGGLDALIFTATAGERSPILRKLITDDLKGLNIEIDEEKNESCVSRDGVISLVGSVIKVAIIKTNEFDEILKISKNL